VAAAWRFIGLIPLLSPQERAGVAVAFIVEGGRALNFENGKHGCLVGFAWRDGGRWAGPGECFGVVSMLGGAGNEKNKGGKGGGKTLNEPLHQS